MSQPTRTYTTDQADFKKLRIETVSLVNAASNSQAGFGSLQAGIHLIYPSENVSEDGKLSTRIFFVSPQEILKKTPEEIGIAERLSEIARTTPIRFDRQSNSEIHYDRKSEDYARLEKRIVEVVNVAIQNFRRDAGELLALFDAYTQPNLHVPPMQTFHLHAAFDNRELLSSFRAAHGMPASPPPSLTPDMRESLARRGISTHGIADRGAVGAAVQGLLHEALPDHANRLRHAAQGSEHGKEVQMIMHVLGAAIVKGEIPSLVMGQDFRNALTQLIASARMVPPRADEGAATHVSQ